MGLFGNSKKSVEQSPDLAQHQKNLSNVFDLFPNIDFDNFPDKSFIKGQTETSDKGEKLIYYRKNLGKKEGEIFDALEIIVFEDSPMKSFIFSNSEVSTVNLKDVAQLIDNFFLFYGADISDRGKFNSTDIEEFNDGYWQGRFWSSQENGYQAVFSMHDKIFTLAMLKFK